MAARVQQFQELSGFPLGHHRRPGFLNLILLVEIANPPTLPSKAVGSILLTMPFAPIFTEEADLSVPRSTSN